MRIRSPKRAPFEKALPVPRQESDGFLAPAVFGGPAINQAAFSRTRGAGYADHIRPAGFRVDSFQNGCCPRKSPSSVNVMSDASARTYL